MGLYMAIMTALQETGFYNWFAVKVVKISKQNPMVPPLFLADHSMLLGVIG